MEKHSLKLLISLLLCLVYEALEMMMMMMIINWFYFIVVERVGSREESSIY